MRVVYLHTIPYRYEINNLINDVLSNVKKDNSNFYSFPSLKSSGNVLLNLLKLRSFLKKNNIDVIHVYDYVDAYIVLKIIKGLKVRLVFSDYCYHDDLNRCRKRIYKSVLKNVDHVIFQSETHKNYMMDSFEVSPEKCSKLYHAFSLERFDDFEYKSVRDEFFIDDLRYLIGTKGDFTPERNVMAVFKMIRKLRRTGRNFTCVVAGDQVDEYDSNYNACRYYYIRQGLDNYITFIGRREDDANLLTQLDLFVYNSAREPIAIPVIEAMMSGVNVVVNDCDMIREITSNGKYATLYQNDNDSEFAIKSREILFDLEDYKLISQVVKEETRQMFSIDKHINKLEQIYSKVISEITAE